MDGGLSIHDFHSGISVLVGQILVQRKFESNEFLVVFLARTLLGFHFGAPNGGAQIHICNSEWFSDMLVCGHGAYA